MNKSKLAFLAIAVGTLAMTACGDTGSSKTSKNSRAPISFPSISEEPDSTLPPPAAPKVKINGGEATEVERGTPIQKPADPTNIPAGKKFLGWKNVKNAGQIWNFDDEKLNQVLEDVELEPLFVDDVTAPQYLEAEMCPDIQTMNDGDGMEGSTYSGGQKGKGLIYKDKDNSYPNTTSVSSISYYKSSQYRKIMDLDDSRASMLTDKVVATEDITYGAFVEFMYVKNNVLTFKVNADEACTDVALVASWSAEYGIKNYFDEITEVFTSDEFKITVNGTQVNYGTVTFNQIPLNKPDTFRDFYLGNISLNKGENTILAKVDNLRTLNGTIASSAPVFDSFKIYTSNTLTQTNIKPTNLVNDDEIEW